MSVADVYTKGFHKQTRHYYAQWLPTQTISLGTVGVLEGDVFRAKYTLADFDIPFDPEADVVRDPSPSSFKVASSRGASVTTKLAGQANTKFPAIPTASAGVGITFSSQGAFVVQAAEVYEPRIRSTAQLERGILRAYDRGTWKKNYAVIYSIVEAPYVDIVISESKASSLALTAAADGAVGGVTLGDAEAGLTVTHMSGAVLDMTGSRNVTPAFQLLQLKRRIFGRDTVEALDAHGAAHDALGAHGPALDVSGGEPDEAFYLERLGEPLP